MADPFSVSVGILTTLGAAGVIAKGLRKLLSVRQAPFFVHALNNEVADLKGVILETVDLLQIAQNHLGSKVPPSLLSTLERLREILKELENLLKSLIIQNADGSTRVDWVKFLRSGKQIQCLQQKIRERRQALDAASNRLTSKLTMENNFVSKAMSCSVAMQQKVTIDSHSLLQELFEHLRATQSCETNNTIVRGASKGHLTIEPDGHKRSKGEKTKFRRTSSMSQNAHSTHGVSSEYASFPLSQLNCPTDCHCQCHSSLGVEKPSFLSTVLGKLFAGYRASPWIRPTCNESGCRLKARQTTIVYTFPSWLLQGVIVGSLSFNMPKGPELTLRMMRIRDETWTFQGLIMFKQHESIVIETQRQLTAGETSVLDVTTKGASALHLALYHKIEGLAELLVNSGADKHYKDSYGRSPFMIAWEQYWKTEPSSGESIAHTLFSDAAHFDDFQFSELHKAYLGINNIGFDKLLAATSRNDLNATDVQGRTVLSWAAGRGDYETTYRLLVAGANPEIPSIDGWTALHYAAEAPDVQCMEILLEFKADVNAPTLTRRTSLHLAVDNSTQPEKVKCLKKHGAELDTKTLNGWTPLQRTFIQDSTSVAEQLLSMGAKCGMEDVNLAIQHNSHPILPLLLTHAGLDLEEDTEDDYCAFHHAAHYADLDTLKILSTSWPDTINLTARTSDGQTVLEAAKWRRDSNLEWSRENSQPLDENSMLWYAAFEDMVESIQDREKVVETPVDSERDDDEDIDDYFSSDETFSSPDEEDADF